MNIRRPSARKSGFRQNRHLKNGRLQKSRAFNRKNGLRALLVLVSFLFVVKGFSYSWHFFCSWDLFRVAKVRIEGCHHSEREEVLRLSGITTQTNILALDLDAVSKAIKTHPWIKSVEIRRTLPDHLAITVAERTPVAIVNAGDIFLADRGGVLFKRVEKGEVYDYPIITGLSPEQVENGLMPEAGMKALKLIAKARQGTRTLGASNISQVHLDGKGGMVLYTAGSGIPLHFSGKDLNREFARAEKILFQLYQSGAYRRVAEIVLDYGPGRAWARLKQ